MYNKKSFFSRKLSLLYAVLTFLIVLEHSAPMGRFGGAVNMDYPFIYCSIIFCYISVPLFFFMSSMLFYRSCDYSDLKRKLHSRIYSLLIPYLLWNTIFVLIYFTINRIPAIAGHMHMHNVLADPYSFFIAIVDSRFTPLWFVRDLMCFCLFSPVILFIIKRIWLAGIVFCLSVFVTCYWDFSHQNVITWIPVYLLGAIAGRYLTYKESEDTGSTMRSLVKSAGMRVSISVALAALFIGLYLLSVVDAENLYLFRLLSPVVLWILVDFTMYDYILHRFKRRKWMEYTFFIYCTHYFVLNVIQKLATIWIEPTPLAMNVIFVLSPVITIALLTCLGDFLSRFSFYKYLSGKR